MRVWFQCGTRNVSNLYHQIGFKESWFFPGTVIGYWLSNVLGILMMQFGAMDMLVSDEKRNTKRDLLIGLGGSTLYTLLVAALAYFHVLEVPDFLATKP